MNELALFAGAGGGILGGHLLGWRTVCAVEWELYAASVLISRQNDGILPPFPVWDDVQTFDGKPWRGRVDIVSGGFPCQDISAAGKGAGIDGERSGMWGHMARIVDEVRPRFVFVENSPFLVGRGLTRVLSDLSSMGYDAEWCVLGAHHVSAPHKRDRIWLIATDTDSESGMSQQESRTQREGQTIAHNNGPKKLVANSSGERCREARELRHGESAQWPAGGGEEMADTESKGLERLGSNSGESEESELGDCCAPMGDPEGVGWDEEQIADDSGGQELPIEAGGSGGATRGTWWAIEPDVDRVAHGVAARVDRLKALGNGQVPAVAELAWKTLRKPNASD